MEIDEAPDKSKATAQYSATKNWKACLCGVVCCQVVIVGACIIAQAFFSVYTMSVDTLFICYSECLFLSLHLCAKSFKNNSQEIPQILV